MHENIDHDENDIGWAFRVLQLHGSVIRQPDDVPGWRKAIRKMAREHGLRIKTGLTDSDHSIVWAVEPGKARDPQEAREAIRNAFTEEGKRQRLAEQGPGGWNWDKRARRPSLKATEN